MSALIFRLRNVPEDEAADVRALLDEHDIEWYETTAGNWGIAMPALWVQHDEQKSRARQLIEAYQHERGERLRREQDERKAAGIEPGLFDRIKERPLACAGIILFCGFIVYVTLSPFLRLISTTRG